MANFTLKIPNSRDLSNRVNGSTEQSLIDTTELADPENPLLHASIWGISPAQAK